jgi:3-oxoacyl-[acyl-carrier protein] reductase
MPLPLESKIALVTGASKGIGKAIAIELARRGADVAVNYLMDSDGAESAVREIRALGRESTAIQADVSNSGETARLFEKTLGRLLNAEIVVNHAGAQASKPLVELTEAERDRVISTNL